MKSSPGCCHLWTGHCHEAVNTWPWSPQPRLCLWCLYSAASAQQPLLSSPSPGAGLSNVTPRSSDVNLTRNYDRDTLWYHEAGGGCCYIITWIMARTHSSLWRLDRDTGHGTGHSCGCRSASDNSCQLSQAVKPQLRWLLLSQSRTCIFKDNNKANFISFVWQWGKSAHTLCNLAQTIYKFKFLILIIILDSSN